MAQTKYSVNLSAADFTFSFYYKGPSVIIPGPDQNYFQGTAGWAGESPQRGINIPQMMYCENTVPTAEGYRSVAYKYFIEPALPLTQRFVRYFPLFEGTGASALVGLTADRKLYVCRDSTAGVWTLTSFVTWESATGETYPAFPPWDEPGQVTATTYAGEVGTICIKGVGVFGLDSNTNNWLQFPVRGVDPTLINGICSTSGYLVVWDDTTVYWSSTEANYDFTPSLITGAGSAKVQGLKGKIKLCKEVGGGFIIYSDVSVIGAAYSSNTAIPWMFDVLAGGAGVRHDAAVSADINSQIHFAWTTGGLMGIELHQCKPMFPQLTDFIASGISDSSTVDGYPVITNLDAYKEVYAAVISSRYLCVSFGTLDEPLIHEYAVPRMHQAFLYDLQLKRWGKLNVDHVQLFETPFLASNPKGTCEEQLTATIAEISNVEEDIAAQEAYNSAYYAVLGQGLVFGELPVDRIAAAYRNSVKELSYVSSTNTYKAKEIACPAALGVSYPILATGSSGWLDGGALTSIITPLTDTTYTHSKLFGAVGVSPALNISYAVILQPLIMMWTGSAVPTIYADPPLPVSDSCTGVMGCDSIAKPITTFTGATTTISWSATYTWGAIKYRIGLAKLAPSGGRAASGNPPCVATLVGEQQFKLYANLGSVTRTWTGILTRS